MKLKQRKDDEDRGKKGFEIKNTHKDSGSAVRLE